MADKDQIARRLKAFSDSIPRSLDIIVQAFAIYLGRVAGRGDDPEPAFAIMDSVRLLLEFNSAHRRQPGAHHILAVEAKLAQTLALVISDTVMMPERSH